MLKRFILLVFSICLVIASALASSQNVYDRRSDFPASTEQKYYVDLYFSVQSAQRLTEAFEANTIRPM